MKKRAKELKNDFLNMMQTDEAGWQDEKEWCLDDVNLDFIFDWFMDKLNNKG